MKASAVFALCFASAPLLAATPDAPPAQREALPERPNVIVLELQATTSSPEVARLVTDLVAVSLQRTGRLGVLTNEDVRSVMAFEAEKQAVGCDDASCLAELAGALGAHFVVHGSVGQLGELFVVNLNLFDSRVARSAGRESAQVRDRSELPAAIDSITRELVSGVVALPAAAVVDVAPASASSPGLSPLFLGGATVGVLAGGGAVLLGAWALTLDSSLASSSDAAWGERAEQRERGLGVVAGASALALAAVGGVVIASVPFFE